MGSFFFLFFLCLKILFETASLECGFSTNLENLCFVSNMSPFVPEIHIGFSYKKPVLKPIPILVNF